MSDNNPLVDEHDIDEKDELHRELFDHVLDLRSRGHTPKEITPRLREIANSLEEHFGGRYQTADSDEREGSTGTREECADR